MIYIDVYDMIYLYLYIHITRIRRIQAQTAKSVETPEIEEAEISLSTLLRWLAVKATVKLHWSPWYLGFEGTWARGWQRVFQTSRWKSWVFRWSTIFMEEYNRIIEEYKMRFISIALHWASHPLSAQSAGLIASNTYAPLDQTGRRNGTYLLNCTQYFVIWLGTFKNHTYFHTLGQLYRFWTRPVSLSKHCIFTAPSDPMSMIQLVVKAAFTDKQRLTCCTCSVPVPRYPIFERFQRRFRIDIMNPPTQTTSNFWTMTLLDHFAKPIPSFNLWKFPEISVSTYARNSAPSCYLGDCVGAGQGIAIPILKCIGTRN